MLTLSSKAVLDKLIVLNLFDKFAAFDTTRNFNCVNDSPPIFLILSKINSVPALPNYFSQIHFDIILPSTKGDRGRTVVKVLCYKSEGRWFDSDVIGIFH